MTGLKKWMMAFRPTATEAKKSLLFFVVFGVVPIFIASILVIGIFLFRPSLPPLSTLERIEPPLITKIYDDRGEKVHEFFIQRRVWTEFSNFPSQLVLAVIAIEDRDFFHHWGIDIWAYPSAVIPVLFGGRMRGASTLTQQLAKNLFLTAERSVQRKIKEALLAIRIERTYTKEEILEFYLNQVYLGAGAYGFQSASQIYFQRSLDSLTLPELATLAGLLQRPESFRPDRHPQNAEKRRGLVLDAMRDEGFLSMAEWELALQAKVVSNPNRFATRAPYFVESIRMYLEKKWGEDFLYNKGIHVHTTLNRTAQKSLEQSVDIHLTKVRRRLMYRTAHYFALPRRFKMPMDTVLNHWDSVYTLFDSLTLKSPEENRRRQSGLRLRFPDSLKYREAQMGAVLIENSTGAVKAMVGGEDFEKSKFNRVLQALRSPGSAFKAIVYSAAVEKGANPMDSLDDQPVILQDPDDASKTWRPKNYDASFSGKVILRKAFYQSKNLPAIKLAMEYGLRTVVDYARRFGLEKDVPAVPSIGIGAGEATVLEMASAYTVFPNLGVRIEPYFIEKILDKEKNLLYRNRPDSHRVINAETAGIMLTLLQDVNIRGTAAVIWAEGFHHPSGGKTGTTNRETDAWYIGFTYYYTLAVWVGVDDNSPLGPGHTGTRDAAPVWLRVMKELHEGKPKKAFNMPRGVRKYSLCRVTGKLSGPRCSGVSSDYFIYGRQPKEDCNGNHQQVAKMKRRGGDMFSLPDSRTRGKGEKNLNDRKTF